MSTDISYIRKKIRQNNLDQKLATSESPFFSSLQLSLFSTTTLPFPVNPSAFNSPLLLLLSFISGLCHDLSAGKMEQMRYGLYDLKMLLSLFPLENTQLYERLTDIHIFQDQRCTYFFLAVLYLKVIKLVRKYFTGDLLPKRIWLGFFLVILIYQVSR